MRKRRWTDKQLKAIVSKSRSLRQVLIYLGLSPAGGNYTHVKKRIQNLGIDTTHFLGQGWNIGMKFVPREPIPLSEILVKNSSYQSYKLKKRLFRVGLKKQRCELCGWNKEASGGRIPLELDHINGNKFDNRIKNLRVLCPNCHSLQMTHRGLNRVK